MSDILHKVGIKASLSDTYRALTTLEGLAKWWTSDTRGNGDLGGMIQFRFGANGGFDMKVIELEPATRVVWEVVDGPGDWIGSKVSFELRQDAQQATVLFKHRGWQKQSEFMRHCSTKWATFLLSLKSAIETGKGRPYPDDLHITLNAD